MCDLELVSSDDLVGKVALKHTGNRCGRVFCNCLATVSIANEITRRLSRMNEPTSGKIDKDDIDDSPGESR